MSQLSRSKIFACCRPDSKAPWVVENWVGWQASPASNNRGLPSSPIHCGWESVAYSVLEMSDMGVVWLYPPRIHSLEDEELLEKWRGNARSMCWWHWELVKTAGSKKLSTENDLHLALFCSVYNFRFTFTLRIILPGLMDEMLCEEGFFSSGSFAFSSL